MKYTRPERSTARAQCRKVAERVREDGGCAHCLHRDRTLLMGRRAACGLNPPRSFPRCLRDAEGFAFDEDTMPDTGD